jgi:iron complex transport system substrate-binding protein
MRTSVRVGIVGLLIALVGCGGADDASVTTVAETTTTEAAPAEFPVTVGDLTLETEPTRIVSLSPTATEMLYAVGAGPQVVAVDDFSNYPAEAAALGTALSGYEPNVEAIAGYEPDLVVIAYDTQGLMAQLQSLDIPVFMAAAAATLDGVYEQIAQIGALTGHASEAEALVASMREEIETAVAGVEVADPALTYFHELDDTYYTVTSNTFVGAVYSLFGLVSIADGVEEGNDYPQLSAEVIVEKDPDLIFLADTKCCGQSAQTVAARDGWAELSAVKNGHVVELDDDLPSRWGPRIVEFVKAIAAAVAKVLAAA